MADSLTLSLFPEGSGTVEIICGADEAGRGPIAGPVYAAAVILDPDNPIEGLKDSKKLSEKQRDACCTIKEIDQLNILWASMLAMKRAIESLSVRPTFALIDGNRIPKGLPIPAEAVVKGDDKVPEISAASILAMTTRDAVMMELHARYPEYGFDRHKGYPTAYHLQQLEKYGVSPVHRRSYAPVRRILGKQSQKGG